MNIQQTVLCRALLVVACLAGSASAMAQGRTLWLSADSGPLRAETEEHLSELLAGSSDKNLVGTRSLASLLESGRNRVPPCLDGRGECTSLHTATAQSFGVRQVVAVRVRERSESAAAITCTVRSPDAGYERVVTAEAGALRAALLQCVGAITEGRGRLSIATNPPGARVAIDDEPAGVTPLDRSLDVGVHLVRIEAEGFHPIYEPLEVRPNARTERSWELERSVAIMLVRSGTDGAVVQLDDGDERHPVGEEVLVEPGVHTVTVSAPGYAPIRREIEFQEGERVELRAALSLSNEEITRRERERIMARPIMLQAGLQFSRFHTDWHGASVDGTTPSTAIACAIRPTTGECQRPGVTAFGLQLEALYAWKWLEIQPLGVGYRILGMSDKGTDYRLDDDQLRLSHKRAHRWMLRVAHVGGRYLIDEYWEPYARVGLTVNLDRGKAEDLLGDSGDYRFKRTGLAFEFRAGTRFHVNALLYGYGELLLSAELKNPGTRPEWGLAGGIGVNLPSPFARTSRSSEAALEQESTP